MFPDVADLLFDANGLNGQPASDGNSVDSIIAGANGWSIVKSRNKSDPHNSACRAWKAHAQRFCVCSPLGLATNILA